MSNEVEKQFSKLEKILSPYMLYLCEQLLKAHGVKQIAAELKKHPKHDLDKLGRLKRDTLLQAVLVWSYFNWQTAVNYRLPMVPDVDLLLTILQSGDRAAAKLIPNSAKRFLKAVAQSQLITEADWKENSFS